jgi:hypothetical protein
MWVSLSHNYQERRARLRFGKHSGPQFSLRFALVQMIDRLAGLELNAREEAVFSVIQPCPSRRHLRLTNMFNGTHTTRKPSKLQY